MEGGNEINQVNLWIRKGVVAIKLSLSVVSKDNNITIIEEMFVQLLLLCAIFLKITKYSQFHDYSINIQSDLGPDSICVIPYGITLFWIYSYTNLIDLVSILFYRITFPYAITWESIWKHLHSSGPLLGMRMRSKPLSGIPYCSSYPLLYSLSCRNILIYEILFLYLVLAGLLGFNGFSIRASCQLFYEKQMRRKEKATFWWVFGKYIYSLQI